MNNFIKSIIEEKFASKKQQRYFFAKAGDKSLPKKERKKWGKWAKEFSDKTDFEDLPEKTPKEVDEIVDEKGNIKRGKKSSNFDTKGISQRKTTDVVVKTGAGTMGTHGVHGTHTSLRYWAENKEKTIKDIVEIAMNKALGYEETLGQDENYDDAKEYMEDELGIPEDEAEERLDQMGYDEKLDNEDKVRLVENPKKFIEEFIESILSKKYGDGEFVKKGEGEIKEVSPIIKRQIKSFKDTLESHGLSLDDVKEYFKDNE